MFHHILQASGAEGDTANTTGVHIPFIDNGGAQVFDQINHAGCNEIRRPRNTSQDFNRAFFKQTINFTDLIMAVLERIEDFG